MATLQKLQISGIRSFGPYEEHTQQLKFETPLTLILGQNGCGKTTIIESIKYACTGELPAGSDCGKGFVHDPKINRSATTKGQIKLKFLDPKGNEITVSRVVELQQTPQTQKFSTKSSCIRTVTPAGEDKSLPGRCADITAECCQVMNVSPAVLNNVIFCHQENSAWPLDEGKKLKEKFDEIFEADRYKSYTENLRKLIKARENRAKILKIEYDYKKDKKQEVEKQRRILQSKEDNLDVLENDITTKREKLQPIIQRIDEIFELEKVLSDLQVRLTTKQATKDVIVKEQISIKGNMSFEFEGTDEELLEKIDSFEKDKRNDETCIAKLEKETEEIEDKTKVVTRNIQDCQMQLGKLNQEKDQHKRKCNQRTTLFNKAKALMDVNIALDSDDNDNAKVILEELKSELENQEMELEGSKREKEMQEIKLQKNIDEARVKVTRTEQDISSKGEKVSEHTQKLREITNELQNVSAADELTRNCTKKINEIDKSLFNLKCSFKETAESQKIETSRKEIYDMEQTLETLEGEYRDLQQNDVIEGKLEAEKQLIMEKQKEINRIKAKHADNLKQLFGDTTPETNLKDSVLNLQNKSDAQVKIISDQITRKQKEVTTLEVQRQHKLETLASHEKELKLKQGQLSQACDGRDFNEILQSTYQKKEKLQVDTGQYSSVQIIYEQFVKKFEEKTPCCPVCRTEFTGKFDSVREIISRLRNKIDKVPETLMRVETELKKEEALYNKLQQLKFVNDEVRNLSEEKLPQLKKQLAEINQQLDSNKMELESLKVKVEEPQKITNIAKGMITDVASMEQSRSDVNRSRKTIESLEKDRVQVASNKSKLEVEAQLDFLRSEISEHRRIVDAQTKKINSHKDRLQKLTCERSELVQKQMSLSKSVQGKPMLESQQKELDENVVVLKREIDALKTALMSVQSELADAIAYRADVVKKNNQQIEEERLNITKYTKIIHEIEQLQVEIDLFLREAIDEKLEQTENKLKEYKNNETTLSDFKAKILDAISKKRQDLAKQELNFRTLKSNVTLREKNRLENELTKEITVLKKQIGGHNFKTVYEEKRRLTTNRENLEKEINTVVGEKNSLNNAIEELRQDLATPDKKNAHSNYLSKFYELNVNSQIIKDLYNFVVALEKAVLDFHKAKMTQINKNIRELWRNIYRGNDIDYIEIKTEHANTAGEAKRRSYNYKVVQMKRGIELDMRGRCSAGQKVLACLVIRMALAETLSSNCGILAMDEPTTNLDKENILSLSDTLVKIVRDRQREKNFQLLVITHDEEFINALTRVEGVSHYYRVQRDNEGLSVINREYAM